MGRVEDRIETLSSIRKIAEKEGTSISEQLWDALWVYAELKKGELDAE